VLRHGDLDLTGSNSSATIQLKMRDLHRGHPFWLVHERPRQAYPALATDLDVDVAVVGGGMTGATVAAVFSLAGLRVAVLESGLIGSGSTAASTALLLREPDMGLRELGRRYGATKARRIWQLSAAAARDFIAFIRRLRIRCDAIAADSIYYTLDQRKILALRAELERRHRASLAGDWLDADEVARLTGIHADGAIRSRRNAQFNPYLACRGLMHAAARAGARVYERSRVSRIERRHGFVRVMSRRGSVRAEQAVIATGYAAPPFQPPVGRFRLHRTFVVATEPISRRAREAIGLHDVMLWDTERPYHYARWTPDHRLMLGGADRPVPEGDLRAAAFRRGIRELQEYFSRVFPALPGIRIEHAWDGLFATTPDGLPYIGRHSRFPGRLFALGYGGNGMTFGFLAAQMLLEQVRGADSPDHALFGFRR
jgi:glycine/D-amino acid oxidase-like deaminating enzyme